MFFSIKKTIAGKPKKCCVLSNPLNSTSKNNDRDRYLWWLESTFTPILIVVMDCTELRSNAKHLTLPF